MGTRKLGGLLPLAISHGLQGNNGATHMFQNDRASASDKQYKIEPLEARRFLSVSADGQAPAEEPVADTTEYTDLTETSDSTYEITSDQVVIGDGESGDGAEVEILNLADGGDLGDGSGITEDGNIICYMTGAVTGAVRTQHPLNPDAAPDTASQASSDGSPPAQSTGFIKAADTGAVAKSVLGAISQSVLN